MFLALSMLALAHAQDTRSALVRADVDEVYAALSDLQRWPTVWGLASDDVVSHTRGLPGQPDQLLRWSGGPQNRGEMSLTQLVEPREIAYDFDWSRPSTLPTAPSLQHRGTLTLTAEGDATRVTWVVLSDSARSRRQEKRVHQLVTTAIGAIERAVELELPDPAGLERRDAVLLWQGMRHHWTYNHRFNRSGDWWAPPSCSGACASTWTHAAASGSGPDRGAFEGRAGLLTGPGLQGWYGQIELWFDGREEEALTERSCIPLPGEVGAGPVLLRGYDLDAVEAADSLWSFGLRVVREEGRVCAEGRLKMACTTPECGADARTVYRLRVPFTVVDGDVATTALTVQQDHHWKAGDLRDEPDPAAAAMQATLEGTPGRLGQVGIGGFEVILDAEHHTKGLDLAIDPGEPDTGRFPVDLDLFYVQWGPVEMAPLTVAQFAHEGSASIRADLVLVQPVDGCVTKARAEGELFWPGKGADASVPQAEQAAEVGFEGCPPAEVPAEPPPED